MSAPARLSILLTSVLLVSACGTPVSNSEEQTPAPPTSLSTGPIASLGEPTSSPSPEPARFSGGAYRIGPWLQEELIGRNWHPGCPVGLDQLRVVRVSYWNFRDEVAVGPLVVHEAVAKDVLWVFQRLFRAGFPIHRIELPPRYRPPRPEDRLSTRNLTSSFNCRPATDSPNSISHHSYGWAIDINPLQNPYVRSDGSVLRRAVKPYLDRTLHVPGMIHRGDVVVRSFARIGWTWGGNWHTLKDYMHFSLTGR